MLLASGQMADAWTASNGGVGEPLAVEHPKGQLHSWFVPVASGKRLLGFFEFAPDLTFHRYSSFQRHAAALEGCPEASVWLDPATVKRTAAKLAKSGEITGEPYFTYDTAPSKLAWAVPLISRSGAERLVFVAGEFAYAGGSPDGLVG